MERLSIIKFHNNVFEQIREFYDYRYVFFNLVRRNLEGRYRNTVLGFLWHFVVPILTIALYYVVFTEIKARPIEDFVLYLSIAIFPLNFISSCLHGRALMANRKFITKMYFPREMVILAETIANFISFLIIYAFIFVYALIERPIMNLDILLLLPLVLLVTFVFGYGCSLIFSTISVLFTDFIHLINPMISLLIWITPTFFLISDVSGLLASIVWYNPLTYFVESFHHILYFGIFNEWYLLISMSVIAAVMFVVGSMFFNRYKDVLPEVL